MSTLVTGGAGFIGSHVVERLLRRGERVICLDNFDDFYDPALKRGNIKGFLAAGSVSIIEGDIRNAEALERVEKDGPVDAIIHAAARAGVRPSIDDPALYYDVNVRGTLNVLEYARRWKVRNMVFISSSSVYGATSQVPFSEDDQVGHPISPYAATKRSGELLAYTYHHLFGLPVTCLRLFTVYGPRQRPEMAIHAFTRNILNGTPIRMFGDGTTSRDYTYVEDIVQGVEAAWERPSGYEIFNLGESQTITLAGLISAIEEATGKKAIIERLPDQPGDVPTTYADVSKARRLLGYQPTTSVRDGITKFVAWYRSFFGRG